MLEPMKALFPERPDDLTETFVLLCRPVRTRLELPSSIRNSCTEAGNITKMPSERPVRETSMVMSTGRRGVCSSWGPRTSQRRSVPTARSPDTAGNGRTGSAFSERYGQAGRNPMYHGDAGPAWDSRKLASMHESTQGSIVPSCSSSEWNVVTGGHQRNCYRTILIGWSVH